MEYIDHNGIVKSSLFPASIVIHGISTRSLGNMSEDRMQHGRAPGNFQRLMELLGIDPAKATVGLLPVRHTSVIASICKVPELETGKIVFEPDREKREFAEWSCGDPDIREGLPANYESGFDAAVSNSRKLYLALLPADCAPVMLYDPKTHHFGLVHAGIIGAITNILPATIRYLRVRGVNPKNLIAYIGPCICSQCYHPSKSRHGQLLRQKLGLLLEGFELKDYLHNQLLVAGLKTENIEITKYCTSCNRALFFSNHAAGRHHASEGRQMAIIGLR